MHFSAPPSNAGADWVLDLGCVDDVDAVYVNGELVGGAAQGPPHAVELRPRASRLLVIRPASGRPQVVETTRHLLPGMVDLDRVTWDASSPCVAVRAGPELVRIEFPDLPSDAVDWEPHFAQQ